MGLLLNMLLHPPFCLVSGCSPCEDLEFVVNFKTSPKPSKTAFICESYACVLFCVARSLLLVGYSKGSWTIRHEPDLMFCSLERVVYSDLCRNLGHVKMFDMMQKPLHIL